jgi:hypothetical protein
MRLLGLTWGEDSRLMTCCPFFTRKDMPGIPGGLYRYR